MNEIREALLSRKAVIFDMDGVLIDSQPFHYKADIAVIQRAGCDATLATVAPYAGVSNPDRWPRFRETLNLGPPVATLIEWQEEFIYKIFSDEALEPIEGIPELLGYIKGIGKPVAVASSSQHKLIDIVLRRLDIAEYFGVIVSGEDVSVGKPEPHVFLFTAERLGLSPDDCVVIEDSPNGITAAKKAGMLCIAYRNRGTIAQDFTLADFVVDKYSAVYADAR